VNASAAERHDILSMAGLDPGAIVRTRPRHGVRYVIGGGIAARLHDLAVTATVDLDVSPARDHKNPAFPRRA